MRKNASFLFGLLFACALGTAGCGTPPGAPVDLAEEALVTPELLRAQTKLEGLVELGEDGTAVVHYARDPEYVGPVRFEAVRFAPSARGAVDVTIAGDFPSDALVVVTDAAFNVLDAALTQTIDDGLGSAHLRVPVEAAEDHFVLVRDRAWQNPMTFEVAIGFDAEPSFE